MVCGLWFAASGLRFRVCYSARANASPLVSAVKSLRLGLRFRIRGLWFAVYELRLIVRVLWLPQYGSRFMVRGLRFALSGSRFIVCGLWFRG